jgi:hypothetical protein
LVLIARPLSKGAGFLFVGWGFGSWGGFCFAELGFEVWGLKTGSLPFSFILQFSRAGKVAPGNRVRVYRVHRCQVEQLPHSLSCSRLLCLATWHFGTGFECTGFIGARLRCSIVLLYAPFYSVWQGGTSVPGSNVPGSLVPG